MLQFISIDSWHFTQPKFSLGWSDLHKITFSSVALMRGIEIIKVTQVGHLEHLTLLCC